MKGSLLVRTTAALLAFVAVVSGGAYLLQLHDNEHSIDAVSLQLLRSESEAAIPPLRVLVTVNSLDPVERKLKSTLSVVARPSREAPLFVDENGRPVFDSYAQRLRPEFAEMNLTFHVDSITSQAVEVPYPLKDAVDLLGIPRNRGVDVSIPADVDPANFPNDMYSIDLDVFMSMPRGLYAAPPVDTPGDRARSGSYLLPVEFGIAAADQLGRWVLDTDRTISHAQPLMQGGSSIDAAFGRGWSYWAFVYAVSLMPAVIGLGFAVRTRRQDGFDGSDTSAAMELATALLALIALRQVFVPADIVGLTRVDILLGVQLLAVCWLIAAAYVQGSKSSNNADRRLEKVDKKEKTKPRKFTRLRGHVPRVPDGAIRQFDRAGI
ncbi:hypothetical protein [Amycolatopsis sp. cmx-4-68]|uniref:hypothetical protein n=1 Tax=Amycolatopsis sp. cmx-4-68 TaxID=2790938 RepID=UPI00397E08C7